MRLHDGREKAQDSYGRSDQQAGSKLAPITGLDSFKHQPLRRVNPASVSKVIDLQTGELHISKIEEFETGSEPTSAVAGKQPAFADQPDNDSGQETPNARGYCLQSVRVSSADAEASGRYGSIPKGGSNSIARRHLRQPS